MKLSPRETIAVAGDPGLAHACPTAPTAIATKAAAVTRLIVPPFDCRLPHSRCAARKDVPAVAVKA
jgi:hypothetical protein